MKLSPKRGKSKVHSLREIVKMVLNNFANIPGLSGWLDSKNWQLFNIGYLMVSGFQITKIHQTNIT